MRIVWRSGCTSEWMNRIDRIENLLEFFSLQTDSACFGRTRSPNSVQKGLCIQADSTCFVLDKTLVIIDGKSGCRVPFFFLCELMI